MKSSVLLALLWTAVVYLLGSSHSTFDKKWKDNVSNISSAYIFSKVGLEIYTKPTQELLEPYPGIPNKFPADFGETTFFKLKNDPTPLFIVWPQTPRPYPLGAWIVYGPISYLFYGLDFSLQHATLVLTFFCFLLAHLSFFMLKKFLPAHPLRYFVLFFCYYEFIQWSGQGQYDIFAMPFLIMALTSRSLVFYGLALFFHLRPLLYAGFIFYLIGSNVRVLFRRSTILAVALGAFAFFVFYFNISTLSDHTIFTNNKYSITNFPKLKLTNQIYLVLTTWGVVAWLFFKKRFELACAALSINLLLFTTPLVRGWYVTFLFPLFVLVKTKPDLIATTLLYIFVASTYLGQSPFDFTFIFELISLVKGSHV